MKPAYFFRTLAAVLAMGAGLPADAQAAHELPSSFADLVEKLSPAVVNVSTTQKIKPAKGVQMMPFGDMPDDLDSPDMEMLRRFFGGRGPESGEGGGNPERDVYSLGSGFIIEAGGFIITNNHVIDDSQDISVTLSDKSKYSAKVIGRDKKTDLALLKIDAKKDLPFVPLGDSDAMRVGDWVIAIGNPYGLGGSVTQGIISARQRSLNSGPFDDFLQTDASINRGNSGGPLFNEKGEVIGINTAIFSPSGGSIGIGFAVPTNVARPVVEQLKQFGRTHRGWLGVKIQEVSEEAAESVGLPHPMGALVLEVSKDSPAGKAGIQVGDVITQFNGRDIPEMRFLPRMVAETKIGTSVAVTYWRRNASKTVQVQLGELDESEDEGSAETRPGKKSKGKAAPSETVLGMDVAPLTPALRDQLHVDNKLSGLAVTGVKAGSQAGKHGVRPGDVIVDVNGVAVTTTEELRKAFADARQVGRKFALVKVSRGKDTAFITLPTGEDKKAKKAAGEEEENAEE